MAESQVQRFLVVEDEIMITMIIEDYLTDIGFEAKWGADNIDEALRIIEENSDIDAAILDVNIRGKSVQPIADALKAKRIPFCFMTGYGASAIPGHPEAPVVSKPFDLSTLQQTLVKLMSDIQ